MFTLNLVIIIRLQVPRLALRRRLSALKGGVSRPAAWRHRPISFLCYILSVSTLRPLACRVRSLWLVEVHCGQQPYLYILLHLLSCLLWSMSDQCLINRPVNAVTQHFLSAFWKWKRETIRSRNTNRTPYWSLIANLLICPIDWIQLP